MNGMNIGDNGYPGAIKITNEGGLAVQMINQTGATSVKGSVVDLSDTADFACKLAEIESVDPVGVIYEGGIAIGELVWVVYLGLVDVLLEDGTAATRGYWVSVSTTQTGRADATNAQPPGGTIAAIEQHFTELGHCFESKGSGTDVLARVNIHFN